MKDYNPKLMDRYHGICVLLTNSKEDMDGLEAVLRTIMSDDDNEAKERWELFDSRRSFDKYSICVFGGGCVLLILLILLLLYGGWW